MKCKLILNISYKQINLLFTLLLMTSILSPSISWAATTAKKVAKVIIMRGSVQKSSLSEKGAASSKISRGMWLNEGDVVKTASRSFAKLLFVDKSQINVGPNSQMAITSFPKKKAGIISLLQGELRAKVSKNYMQIKDKNKSKLFIKTKTAALGVRGTDFQVIFNLSNKVTSLVTFEGRVAMAKISENLSRHQLRSQKILEKLVSSKAAVIVKQGQFSGVSPVQKRVTIPVKISPAQLETLKSSEKIYNSPTSSNSKQPGASKQVRPDRVQKRGQVAFRNPIPPGMKTKMFANAGTDELEKEFKKNIGHQRTNDIALAVTQSTKDTPPPEGFVDHRTGAVAPPAGGFIDLKTALYIPPPPGSNFDANTGVYVPPPNFGTFDRVSGDYLPPEGFELRENGDFIVKMELDPERKHQPDHRSAHRPEGREATMIAEDMNNYEERRGPDEINHDERVPRPEEMNYDGRVPSSDDHHMEMPALTLNNTFNLTEKIDAEKLDYQFQQSEWAQTTTGEFSNDSTINMDPSRQDKIFKVRTIASEEDRIDHEGEEDSNFDDDNALTQKYIDEETEKVEDNVHHTQDEGTAQAETNQRRTKVTFQIKEN
ncbi:MAG: FecR domain-containing protein [Bdellovibrionales bacterium]|nr:FecR domain-containing protein [Bdellovibrionales bacterium]MBT3525299.1 FecR domain-containing protein [Bdellovibrionales bacterium]MBT7767501.1 FecR domain-containing protein [Bdellovibrionales bacterium]